jgi:hypothetical protein
MSNPRKLTVVGIMLLAVAVGVAAGQADKATDAKYKVTLTTDPAPLKGMMENTFHATLTDPKGKPVSDAQVEVMLVMPAMPSMKMPEMKSSVNMSWNGKEYVGKGNVAMAGPWTVTVTAKKNDKVLAVHKADLQAK